MTHAGAKPLSIPALNYEGSPLWTSAFLFTPTFCECAYHGHCASIFDALSNQTRTVCVCDQGWTGFSDFIDARGASCHINEEAVRYLWVANLFFWVVSLTLSATMTRDLFKKHLESREKMKRKGKPFRVWDNQGLFSVVLGLTIAMPGLVITGILRLAVPDVRVALDFVVTFFWFAGRLGISLGTSIHQPALMKQMLRAQSSADGVIREYDRYGKILAFSQAAAALWSIPVLATRGRDIVLARVCFGLFCFQVSMGFFLLMRQSQLLRRTLFAILTDSATISGNATLLSLRDRLCAGQVKIQKQTCIQAVVYLVFAISPPLWMTYDYMLPISWFTPPILLHNVISAIHDERNKDPTSPSTTQRSSKQEVAEVVDENGRKPFEIPESIKFEEGKSSYNAVETAVEVQDADDDILVATGDRFTHGIVMRSIKSIAGRKNSRKPKSQMSQSAKSYKSGHTVSSVNHDDITSSPSL